MLAIPEGMVGRDLLCPRCQAAMNTDSGRRTDGRLVIRRGAVASMDRGSRAATSRSPAPVVEASPSAKATLAGLTCAVVASVFALVPGPGWYAASPLVVAAFVLAIVAMARGAVFQGIGIVLVCLTLPAVCACIGCAGCAAFLF